MTTRFNGLPAEAFEFYEALAANNNRAWWQENRDRYERDVRAPLQSLLDELAEEFGTAHLFRPHRDARFSREAGPIKDHQGAFVGVEDGVGYYVQLSADGLLIAGGWHRPAGLQLVRFREAVQSGHAPTVRTLLTRLEKQGWAVEGRPLKTKPRGVAADNPDLDLLRLRELTVSREQAPVAWLGTRKALTEVRARWRQVTPLTEWLGEYVGPATDPALPPV